MFEPTHEKNLALYSENWVTNIYDLRSYYDGFCHTFNPAEAQKRRQNSKLSLYLGHDSIINNYGRMFKQFNVVIQTLTLFRLFEIYIIFFQFIHSKGIFWPRNRLPDSHKISVGRNKSVEIRFKIDSTQKIARDQEKCIEVTDISTRYKRYNRIMIFY